MERLRELSFSMWDKLLVAATGGVIYAYCVAAELFSRDSKGIGFQYDRTLRSNSLDELQRSWVRRKE